jgi:hypothetical protein
MNIGTDAQLGVERLIERAYEQEGAYNDGCRTVLALIYYGHLVFSQFGLGLVGLNFRRDGLNWKLAVKVMEGNTPLVGYVTSHTTSGCMEQLFLLLDSDKMRWHLDRYPVI